MPRRDRWAALAILSLGFVFACFFNSGRILGLGGDALVYNQLALNLGSGRGFSQVPAPPFAPSLSRPPGYPAFLASLYAVFGKESFEAVRLAQIALILLAAVCAAWLVQAAFADRLATLATLFLCCFYSYEFGGKGIYTYVVAESLTTFAVSAGALLSVLGGQTGRLGAYLLGAAFFSLASLTRPSNLYFPLAVSFLIPVSGPERRKAAALFLMAAFLLPLAWSLRNQARFGRFTLAYPQLGIGQMYATLNNPDAGLIGPERGSGELLDLGERTETARNELLAAGRIAGWGGDGGAQVYPHDHELVLIGRELIRRDPWGAAKRCFYRVLGQWHLADLANILNGNVSRVSPRGALKLALKLALALLILIGFWPRRGQPAARLLAAYPVYNTLLYALVGFGRIRFSFPARPLALALLALGLSHLAGLGKRAISKPRPRPFAAGS